MSDGNANSGHETTPSSAHNLRIAAIVIYAVLALLVITIPQGPVNWLHDMNSNPVQEALLRGAEFLQEASQQTGLAAPYQRARSLFFALAGKEEN
jgi:hypothetical protein